MKSFTQLPPLALYIHIPWCVQKCPYCDFNSHESRSGFSEKNYVEALLADLENDLPLVWGRKVSTIFIGGGTPSIFSAEAIDDLLAGVRARIPLSPRAEITMEANPGTIDNERLPGFREAGVNRLSIGVQSFNDTHLKTLGRIHNAAKAIKAIEAAKKAKFERINIDLMFALPQQTLKQARQDLETAIELDPSHISYYELTLEPNTAFYNNPPALPESDEAWEIFEQGYNLLEKSGFKRYEISAYAKTNEECRHNINYWQFGDYLGIGAGAHAKITDASQQAITRYTKKRNPKDFLAAHEDRDFISSKTILDKEHLVFEFLLNALRLTGGFTLDTYEKTTGLPGDTLLHALEKSISQQLIVFHQETGSLKPTDKGINFLNNILEPLLPEK